MRTRSLSFLILGLALPFLAACGNTTTEPADTPSFFPLAVGNTWTYAPEQSVFGDPFEWRVAARQGDTISLTRPPLGSHPGPVTLLEGPAGIGLVRGDGTVGPYYRFTVGASWVRPDPWECDDGARVTVVPEPDPVVTPAGTFRDCLRIERLTQATCTDAGTMVEWWAPGVGLVKWEELNYYLGAPLAFELVSYSLEPGP